MAGHGGADGLFYSLQGGGLCLVCCSAEISIIVQKSQQIIKSRSIKAATISGTNHKSTGKRDSLASRGNLICSSFESYCTTTQSNNHLDLILVCMTVHTREQGPGDVGGGGDYSECHFWCRALIYAN